MTQLQFDPMRELPPVVETTKARPGVRMALVLLIALGLGAGLWFLLRPTRPSATPPGPGDTTASSPTQPVASSRSTSAQSEPPPPSGLPDLAQSDAFVRSLAAELFGSPEVDSWLTAGEELVQRGVRALLAIAERRSPRRFLGFLPFEGRFETLEREGRRIIAPESYRRYDRLVDVFVGLDSEQLNQFLERLGPLLSQAMDENAFPGTAFGTKWIDAIEQLLSTPTPAGDVEVTLGEDGVYRFADPRLEALSPAQKQLLRLGPSNGARVRAKLDELRLALGAALDAR